MLDRKPTRRFPSRAQVALALLVALATTLVLMGLRDYPWALATLLGLATGALAYTSWGTLLHMRGIYDRRFDRGSEAQGKSTTERIRRR